MSTTASFVAETYQNISKTRDVSDIFFIAIGVPLLHHGTDAKMKRHKISTYYFETGKLPIS